MKTTQLPPDPVFDQELIIESEKHIEEIVLERVKKYESELYGKHLYRISVNLTPSRTSYHTFDYDKLSDISRHLINGMRSLGTISNRKFWSRYFEGGIRTISINQIDPDDFPTFTLNYLTYSVYDNLDVKINSQLNTRIRMIDPTLTYKMDYIGLYDITLIRDHLSSTTNIFMTSPSVQKLGKKNTDLIIMNPFQRPRFLGTLFKPYVSVLESNE